MTFRMFNRWLISATKRVASGAVSPKVAMDQKLSMNEFHVGCQLLLPFCSEKGQNLQREFSRFSSYAYFEW